MKTTITAHISIDHVAWKRVQNLAARQGRALPEVLGELIDEASSEASSQAPKADASYEPPSLLRLWLRRHPDTVAEQD